MAMWGLGIGWKLRLFSFGLFVILCRQNVYSKPLPAGGTVTQTGEPSHFQVDDKAAEIEVNANPAGVKVNAKPASLQVVAKPGTPAIPIFHPSIHLAPHYSAPPLIHHHPASFYQGWGHGGSPWFYGGLKRNRLPLSKESDKQTRRRTHKSIVPHAKGERRAGKANKRQFIQTAPQFMQPSQFGAFLGYYPSPALGLAPPVTPGASLLQGFGNVPAFSPLSHYAPSTPAQPSLAPQTNLEESALSRNMISMRPENSVYPRTPMLPSSKGDAGLYQNIGSLQSSLYSGLLGQQALPPYNSGLMGPRQAPGYARAYVPYAPLSQLYDNPLYQPSYTGTPGYGQLSPRSMMSLLGLQPLSSGTRVFSRSKVPGSKKTKTSKRSLHKVKSVLGKSFKRQVLFQPAGTTDGLENIVQDQLTDDSLKRQLIMNPQLRMQALANQQQLQEINTQQAALSNAVVQQPLQIPESLLQQQQSSNLPQAFTYNPLQSPFSMLTSNYASPMETSPRPRLLAPRMSQRARLATSPFARQAMPYRFANEQPSLGLLGLSQLTGSQEDYQANSPFNRKSFGRPLYRRRLHRPHNYEEEESALPEEDGPIGEESVSQGDAYTQEMFTGNAGKTLLDTSHAGFGPITVEAKTAEGERLAQDDKRRNDVQLPIDAQKPRKVRKNIYQK